MTSLREPARRAKSSTGAVTLTVAAVTGLIVLASIYRSLDAATAERYVQHVYGPLTRVLAPLGQAVPWSLSLTVAVIGLSALAYLMVARSAWGRVATLSVTALVLWSSFVAMWGIHYVRAPLGDRMGLTETVGEAEIVALGSHLSRVVAMDAPTSDGPAGIAVTSAAIGALAVALEQWTAQLDGMHVEVPERVEVLPRGALLAFGTSGIFSPWLLEPHVDGGLPAAAQVAVAAHELAHLAGFAREDEAEAIGAIAGLQAADPYARYAVALFQLASLEPALPSATGAALLANLPERARADLDEAQRAIDRYRLDWLSVPSWILYDLYLRSQGVSAGVDSYARGSSLLARAHAAGYLDAPRGSSAPPAAAAPTAATAPAPATPATRSDPARGLR